MEYRSLGATGATVSRLSLGTMTFGQQADEAAARRMVDIALDGGINFIDTADVYVGGASEEILGRALQGRRDGVVLASKVGNRAGPDARRDGGLHRWHVVRGVEACLRRLQTDCLDILYMHRPDPATPLEESLAAFDLLVRQGKVLYVGMSNHASWQVCEALWKASERRLAAPAVLQVPYNLITRGIEEECVPFADAHGLGLTVYNPVAGGLLTGKHAAERGPEAGTRFALNRMYKDRFWSDGNFAAVERLAAVAAQAGCSLLDLSLRWLLAQGHVSSVILGASRPEQLEQNLRAADGALDDATRAACDEVWQSLRGDHFRYHR